MRGKFSVEKTKKINKINLRFFSSFLKFSFPCLLINNFYFRSLHLLHFTIPFLNWFTCCIYFSVTHHFIRMWIKQLQWHFVCLLLFFVVFIWPLRRYYYDIIFILRFTWTKVFDYFQSAYINNASRLHRFSLKFTSLQMQ